ncbi:MAG: hypothetical protein RLZZ426_42 [Actinomycetota bacterium]
MSFGQAIASCYKNFFVLRGRASRSEYWWFQLFAFLVGIGVFVVAIIVAAAFATSFDSSDSESGFAALGGFLLVLILGGLVMFIAIGIPLIAVGVRRLHDMGQSGWWIGAAYGVNLLSILTVQSDNGLPEISPLSLVSNGLGLAIFVMTLLASQPKDNKYGPMPLSSGQAPMYQGETPPPPPTGYTPL